MEDDTDASITVTRRFSSIMTLEDWGFSSDICHTCGKSSSDVDNLLMQCAKCKKVYYCSVKCFNADIIEHQKICSTSLLSHQPKGITRQQQQQQQQQQRQQQGQEQEHEQQQKQQQEKQLQEKQQPQQQQQQHQQQQQQEVRTPSDRSLQKDQQQQRTQSHAADDNEKIRASMSEKLESGVKSGSYHDDKALSSDDDNKLSMGSILKNKKKKKERKSSLSPIKQEKPIVTVDTILVTSSSKKVRRQASDRRSRSRSGSRKNTPTRRRESQIDKMIASSNHDNGKDVDEVELVEMLDEERNMQADFLNLKTTAIVGQLMSQKHLDYYGEESYDDNSIFFDLTGKMLELVVDDSDSDSGNISDVTYEEKALLGSDEEDSGNDDEDLAFQLPWDGTKSYSNIDPTNASNSSHHRTIASTSLTSTRTWNGRRYCKNPTIIISKELDCDPPEEAFKRTSMVKNDDSWKSILLESNSGHSNHRQSKNQSTSLGSNSSNSGHSNTRPSRNHSTSLESNSSHSGHSNPRPSKNQSTSLASSSGHSKPKIYTRNSESEDIPQFISINTSEHFDQSKLKNVKIVEKKEFAWEVPEWVNGVLLRRNRLGGNIVDTVVVTPNDSDYYEEGSMPKLKASNSNQPKSQTTPARRRPQAKRHSLSNAVAVGRGSESDDRLDESDPIKEITPTRGRLQTKRHSLNNATALGHDSGSGDHLNPLHYDIDLIEKAYFFEKPPGNDNTQSSAANYLTKQRRKSLKSLQSNDVVVINKSVIDDFERSSSPTPDMIRERYGFR